MRPALGVWVLALWAGAVGAHEGHAHSAGAAMTATARPHRDGQDRLHVPKAVQRALALRTTPHAQTPFDTRSLVGEVIPDPDAPGVLPAPQPGRIVAAPGTAWPVAGQTVRAGQVLALLLPQMNARERAQRRSALALTEQKLQLARVNAGRMRLQAQASGAVQPSDNIYLEQAESELATQERLQGLGRESLDGRVALRAPADGTLVAVHAGPGAVLAAGAPLFDIADARRARIAVHVLDAQFAQRLHTLNLIGAPGEPALRVLGLEAEVSGTGWRLLLAAPDAGVAALAPGQLLRLRAQLLPEEQDCARRGDARLWVHVEPEVFESRRVPACGAMPVAAGERVVTQGGALLDEYR